MIDGIHYQTAYVTSDVDDAYAAFAAGVDARHPMHYEGTVEVATNRGPSKSTNKLALAWVGDLQYEFIQPVVDPTGIFADALATERRAEFHHLAFRVADWEAFRAKVANYPYPVMMERDSGDLKFVYLDARATLGHCLEYVWMTDAMWTRTGGR